MEEEDGRGMEKEEEEEEENLYLLTMGIVVDVCKWMIWKKKTQTL